MTPVGSDEQERGKVTDDDLERFRLLTDALEPVSPPSIPKEARVINAERSAIANVF
jgi:hypothetical protein